MFRNFKLDLKIVLVFFVILSLLSMVLAITLSPSNPVNLSRINRFLDEVKQQIQPSEKASLISNVDSSLKNYEVAFSKVVQLTDNRIRRPFILSVIAIALGGVATYLFIRTITRRTHKAITAASQLELEGLAVQAPQSSNNETDILIDSMQKTANELHDMISAISRLSLEFAAVPEELTVIAEQSSLGIKRQKREADLDATARTEENGSGFAVTSDEVPTLEVTAQTLTQETLDIQRIIAQLQSRNRSTEEIINQGKSLAFKCIEQANDTNATLHATQKLVASLQLNKG